MNTTNLCPVCKNQNGANGVDPAWWECTNCKGKGIMIKNPDGTFKHFEMKGGTFAGWLKDVDRLWHTAEQSAITFKDMDDKEVNGTVVAYATLKHVEERLYKLLESMEAYRKEFAGE